LSNFISRYYKGTALDQALAFRYPTIIADNRRMQAVGLEPWLEE
jgi:hypothetical protein